MPNVKFTDFYNNPFSGLELYQDKVKELASEGFGDTLNLTVGLPSAVDGVITLSGAYLIAGTVNIGNNTIVLSGDTQLIGLNERSDVLVYTGNGTAITGEGHSFSTKFLSFSSPNGKMFDLTGTSSKFVYMISNGFFSCQTIGDFSTFRFVAIKLARANGSGSIRFSGAIGKALVTDTPFEDSTATEMIYTSTFDGGAEIKGNWFFDDGGQYIEFEDVGTAQLGIITGNRFTNTGANSNFVGFSEETIGFIVSDNVNQIDSGVFLDAFFSGNTTALSVGTEWVDINVPYEVEYSQRVVWDVATNSFQLTDVRDNLLKIIFDAYTEAGSNNDDYEFAIFSQNGEGAFTMLTTPIPYRFRQSNNTEFISIKDRVLLSPETKFKLRVRKPSGSSNITFLSSKAII